MDASLPILIVFLAAIAGAVLLYFTTRRSAVAAMVGALAGGGGSLIFMLPLNFCTFEAERDSLEVTIGLILILAGMLIVLIPARWVLSRVLNGQPLFVAQAGQGVFRGGITPFVLLAPTLVILALFLYYPSLDTFRLSTLLYRLGAPRSAFVCVDNFTRLVDPEYGRSVLITFGMSAAIVVIGLGLGLLIATAAYQPITGARIYRTFLIWPYAVSPVVAGIIFSLLFNPAGGIINYFLRGLFGITIPWLNDPTWAPWAVILASVWKSLGFNILFYIAGLQNIPKDLTEAASIDGANAIQRFFRVTFPLLSPITFFLIITNITYAFFETVGTLVYLTGGAGPLGSTNTLMFRIYQLGIQNNDLGKAAAQSIMLFLMVIGLTLIQFRTTGERVTYGA
jgi:sn-glycerol 3-phosphate transport system permease protein